MRMTLTLALSLLALGGCANREGVAPSQNASLQSVSPSTTATAEGGIMQRGLDIWLKEEWTPLSAPAAAQSTPTVPAGSHSNTVLTAPAAVTAEPKDNTPFTLQKYADKWKVYHENKAKLNEGKPKEPSHAEQMESLPVIGK